jgi:hypothetical protein
MDEGAKFDINLHRRDITDHKLTVHKSNTAQLGSNMNIDKSISKNTKVIRSAVRKLIDESQALQLVS